MEYSKGNAMKTTDIRIRLTLVATVLAMAFALTSLSATTTPLPLEEQMVGDVTYVTGGVSDTEAAAMRHLADDYVLEVVFMQKQKGQSGEFLADVKVQIQDEQQNTLLDIVTDGPFLLVNLPQGNYLVKAEYYGEVKSLVAHIDGNKHKKLEFWWPAMERLKMEEPSER
jgi:hypothetical protein